MRAQIWLLQTGETLPIGGETARPMRTCMIADALAARGASVTWWASTFDHKTKRRIAAPGHIDRSRPGVEIRLLHGRAYSSNISWQRILSQRDIAADFERRQGEAPRPDLIVTSLPTLELADAGTRLATKLGIPAVIDFRDLWPEVFLDVSPIPRMLTRLLIDPLYRQARRTLARADGIISITPMFLASALELAGRQQHAGDKVVVHAYRRASYAPCEITAATKRWRQRGLALDGTELIFCYLGALSDTPLVSPLLEGLALLEHNERRRIRIVACGEGRQRFELLRRASRDLPEFIAPGHVSGPDVAALMMNSSAGLLPYPNRKDLLMSYPNKVGEYLSEGLPILSSLSGETGRLIESRACGMTLMPTADDWARGLRACANENARLQDMQKNSRDVFHDMFDANLVYSRLATQLIEASNASDIGLPVPN